MRAATEALRRVVSSDPDHGLAGTRLARLCLVDHSFELTAAPPPIDEALTLAQRGVRLDPDSRSARCVLASALLLKGELAAGRDELEQALHSSPGSLVYLEIIGYLLTFLGDWERGPALSRSARGLFRLKAPQGPPVEPPAPAAPEAVAPAPSLPAEVPAPPAAAAQSAPRPAPAVRNSMGTPMAFHLLFPAENATLSPHDLQLQWSAIPGAAYYEAQVMTEEGNVAWSARTGTTSVRLPGDGASLQAGKKYFVWIRAYLEDGGTLKFAAVSFQIADH